MTSISVVIPSKNSRNFLACAAAVRKCEPDVRIVLVDDGIDWSWPPGALLSPYYAVSGEKPFVFARNCNIGINFMPNDDIVLLNDDALLQTPGGFSLLQREAELHQDFGLIGSSCNNVGNTNQFPKGMGLREDSRMVCFTCVFIPRRTFDRVGLLDERFVHYGCEDDDFCFRVRRAGYRIGIHDGCFADHSSLTSSFRGPAGAGGNYLPNLEIFKRKWGCDNWGRQ